MMSTFKFDNYGFLSQDSEVCLRFSEDFGNKNCNLSR
jgi:hypothetical protein